MNLHKRIISVITVLVMIFTFAGCGSEGNDATVYFELLEKPDCLDPQIALSDSEQMIVRNLFEGLMRKDKNGKTVEGACESFKKSGLTYRFKLREGLKWSDGSAVKPEDFVFGLYRALDNGTGAPFASRLFAIKNARAVNSGKTDVSSLGVAASGNSVIIELEYEDEHFLDALTTSVAMPCCEKYFLKTEGKYCQDARTVLCNGSYDIFKWNKDDFGLKIFRNEQYGGIFKAKNKSVLFSCVSKKAQIARLEKEECDIAFLPSAELEDAEASGFKIKQSENICWFLTIGDEYDSRVKNALLSAFSGSVYEEALSKGTRVANSIYPSILSISEADGVGMPQYNLQNAVSLFSAIVKSSKEEKFPNSTLYYYDAEEIKESITALLGHWQQNLCAFINIQSSSSIDKLREELKTRSLQFSLFPVTVHSSSPEEYLYNLGLSGDVASAQAELLNLKNIVPFCFETTNIAYNTYLGDIHIDEFNGYIDFSFILKK